jgi:hypothetical protein
MQWVVRCLDGQYERVERCVDALRRRNPGYSITPSDFIRDAVERRLASFDSDD